MLKFAVPSSRRSVLCTEYLLRFSSVPFRHTSSRNADEYKHRNFCSVSLSETKFSRAQHGPFYQESPQLYNPFVEDYPLRRFLQRHLPKEVQNEITVDLKTFGERIVDEIYQLGLECDQQLPSLITQNSWGKRVDYLWTCPAWKRQHKIAAEEGIVAIGYERQCHEWSRLHQLAKLYLYAPAAGLYTCPIAMTDGAAKTIETMDQNPMYQDVFKRLTSRDSEKFWTSGQWMTERKGGSDVASGTETIAVRDSDAYRLYGYKWFSSATDANMALTLARILNSDGSVKQGSKGLTMFYVETKNSTGELNNIQMVRLKNKLGTRQVPTAELLLDGTVAHKMSDEGHGISMISNMLTITRIHNAVASVAVMRHILRLARDYSQRRYAFGKKIGDFPLHMQTLARMEVETRGSLLLILQVAIWLGKIECGNASDEISLLLRLMSPILKLYTAKQAMAVVSEGLEAFGGQGYMEDSGLPIMLRDAQVLPIWEGTTNILSLDVLRCITKTNGDVLRAFMHHLTKTLEYARKKNALTKSCLEVEQSANDIINFALSNPDEMVIAARDFAFSVARTFIGALFIESATAANSTAEDIIAAQRWCDLDMCPLRKSITQLSYSDEALKNDSALVMEGYEMSP